jgi:putative ABC transport system permease protein
VRFAFSGTRDRRWPAASFVGLMIVLAVAVGALTMGANITRLVEEPAHWGSAPFSIGTGGDDLPDNVRTLLATDPDVAAVTYYGAATVSVGTDSLFIVGIQPARGDLLPPVLSGRLPQSDDEIVLGAVDARTLDLEIGDEFDVSTNAGVERLRVAGLAVIPSVNQGDGIGEGGVVTIGGLHRLDPASPLNVAGLEFREGSAVDTGDRLSRIAGMTVHEAQPTPEIVNIDRISSIPMLVAAVLGAFALLSLTHQLIVSARLRRRDVGILKALGADRRGVSKIVHVQATVFTVAVITLAVPIGVIAGQSVYRVITDGIGASGDAVLSWPALATAIIAPMILANLIAVIPARRARKLRPSLHLNQE